MAFEYTPTYIHQTEAAATKQVITAQHWNELFNLLITQGDNTSSALLSIVNDLVTKLEDVDEEIEKRTLIDTTDNMVSDVTFDLESGAWTITYGDSTTQTINTTYDKIAVNFAYNPTTQKLTLTNGDGTTQDLDLSAFISETEYDDSAYITFNVNEHKVSASIPDGAITEAKLSTTLINAMRGYKDDAQSAASSASTSATNADISATAAASSATAAHDYAVEAKGYRDTAEAHKNSASGSAESAYNYSQTASTKASAASTSEANALEYRNKAKDYRDEAKGFRDEAAAIVGGDYATQTDLSNHNTSTTAHDDIRQDLQMKANLVDLADVASSGSYNDLSDKPTLFSGSYNDLTNKPTVDSTPTANSTNLVTSGGVKTYVDNHVPDIPHLYVSTSAPTTEDGNVGDLWFVVGEDL